MARLILLIAIVVLGGFLVYNLSSHMDYVAKSYDTDNVMEMIENMEAPAAGGDE